MHHTEGHYSAVWHHQCAGQYQCQGTLHVGSCFHGTSAQSPVASNGPHNYQWGTMSWFLKGTSLPVQLEHLCCRNTSQNCGWSGCSCQPSTTGGPPDQDCERDKQASVKKMGLGVTAGSPAWQIIISDNTIGLTKPI